MSKADYEKAYEMVQEDLQGRMVCSGRAPMSDFLAFAFESDKSASVALEAWVETEDGKKWVDQQIEDVMEARQGGYIEQD